MEKQRTGKVIAIFALLFAVVGLSLGFAAFSTTLTISSSADVKLDADTWKVGFSTVNSGITPGTVTGTLDAGALTGDQAGSLDLTQFLIGQTANANATLHTTTGSQVVYSFYIVNDGRLDAYLNSVNMGHLTCTYAGGSASTLDGGATTFTPDSGTIAQADCEAMFTATLTIGSGNTAVSATEGQAISSGFGTNNMLAKPTNSTPTYVPATLTIAYETGSYEALTNAPESDFTVALGTSTVIYGTSEVQ